MPSSLERLDQVRDALINRGIGVSGLTQQAIQRANLPDLGASIAESRATMENLRQERTAQVLGQDSGLSTAINRVAGLKQANRQTTTQPSRLSAIAPVGVVMGGRRSVAGSPRDAGGPEVFSFTTQTSGGQTKTYRGRLEDIMGAIEEFQNRGGQVISEGTLPEVGRESFAKLLGAGVTPTNRPQAEEAFLGRQRRGINALFGGLEPFVQLGRQRPTEISTVANDAKLLKGI